MAAMKLHALLDTLGTGIPFGSGRPVRAGAAVMHGAAAPGRPILNRAFAPSTAPPNVPPVRIGAFGYRFVESCACCADAATASMLRSPLPRESTRMSGSSVTK